IAVAGAKGSALTNPDLIAGLRACLGTAFAGPDGILGTADDKFDQGNIILGGDGSDILEGRGGNDLLDGDMWLNVRIAINNPAPGLPTTVNSMQDLVPYMMSGAINPGQLQIVRELKPGPAVTTPASFDTAVFSDNFANYTVTTVAGVTTVTHNATPPGLAG